MIHLNEIRQGLVTKWVEVPGIFDRTRGDDGKVSVSGLQREMAKIQRELMLIERRRYMRETGLDSTQVAVLQYRPELIRTLDQEIRLRCDFAVGPDLSRLGGEMPPEERAVREDLRDRLQAAKLQAAKDRIRETTMAEQVHKARNERKRARKARARC